MKDNYYLGLLALPLLLSFLTIQGYLPKVGFLYMSIGIFSIVFGIFTIRVIKFKNFRKEFMIILHSLPFVGSLFIAQLYLTNLIKLKGSNLLLISFSILFTLFGIVGFKLLYNYRPDIVKSKDKKPNYIKSLTVYGIVILTAIFLPELSQSSITPIKIFSDIIGANLSFSIIVISYLLLSIYLINSHSAHDERTQEILAIFGSFSIMSTAVIIALLLYTTPKFEEYIISNYNTLQYPLFIVVGMFLISLVISQSLRVYTKDTQKNSSKQNIN